MIAQAVNERNGKLISFEVSYPIYYEALMRIQNNQITNTVLYNMNFLEAPHSRIILHKLDFVFVGGRKSEYDEYVKLLMPYMSIHGMIAIDDVLAFPEKTEGLYAYIQDNHYQQTTHTLSDQDGVMVIQRLS